MMAAVGLALALVAPRAEAAAKQMQITFGGYTNRSEVLTNFPVLVVLSNNVGQNFTFADFVTTNGTDLRFGTNSTPTTNSLNYEIESWNTNAGQTSYVWVQVPTIPTNGSGAIWARWGDTANSNQLACTTNGAVWTNGFAGVWHLKESGNGTSGEYKDSTSNRRDAQGGGGTSSKCPVQTNGVIGIGESFDGSDDYIDTSYSLPTTNFSYSFWAKSASSGAANRPFGNADSSGGLSGANILWGYNGAANLYAIFRKGVNNATTDFQVTPPGIASGWHHVAVSLANSGASLCWDGNLLGGNALATNITSSLPTRFGRDGNGSDKFNGQMDEVRISAVARSTNWVYAEYLNMASNKVFNNYGAMTASGDPNAPAIRNDPVTFVTTNSATFNGMLTSTGGSACAVCLYWGTDTSAWANTNWFNGGAVNSGWTNNTPFSTNIASGISPDLTYYYTYGASNTTTNVVATGPKNFITGLVTVEATTNSAQYPSSNGLFTISRPATCTNEQVTVTYTLSGSAVSNVDYTLSSWSSVTLAAGQTNQSVTVTPLGGVPRTVVLTLSTGNYPTGAMNSATVNILEGGYSPVYWTGASSTNWAASANWTNAAGVNMVPGPGDDAVLDGAPSGRHPTLDLAGGAVTVKSLTLGVNSTSTLTVANGDVTTKKLAVVSNVTIGAKGTLTHAANTTNEAHKLVLDIAGSLTIASGGKIDVKGCGYSGGYGPGRSAARGGGAHGGQGGYGINESPAAGSPYGSVTNPVNCGSASSDNGGCKGGGVVILKSGGGCVLNGTVVAEGNVGADQGGGAGGSINIAAQSFSGGGAVSANGGNDTSNGGGGGGGRIALIASGGDATQFQPLTITAYGGVGATQGKGAAGTVYLKAGSQAYGGLIVANSNLTTAAKTVISTNVTDAVVGDVAIRDQGQLGVSASVTLTVYGNWSNGVSASAFSGGGTVLFAGATTNTLYGSTTFDNFTCQTPGKTLKFEGGKTNTMLAGLTIAGASNNPVSLLPVTAGQQWFIKATNSMLAPPISYVVVSNSTAITNGNGQALTASFSTPEYVGGVDNSLNNNTNWSFPLSSQAKVWDGSESTSWGDGNNWSPSGVPQSTDQSITIPAAPANQPILDVARAYPCPLTVQSGARLTLGGRNLTVGVLTNAGTIVATGSETLTCLNNVNFTGGSFTSALSTVRLAGSSPQTLTANGNTFYVLQIANTNAVTVTDGFNVRDLTFPSSSANVAFDSGFTATNVSVVVTNGASLTFTAGQVYTVRNGLVLSGAAGKPILMNNAGGAWLLNVGGYAAVRYVSADYSDARGGRKIYAVNSTDGGNNQNWDFGAGKLWAGTTTSWTNDANWLPSGAPVSTNFVLIDGSSGNMPRLTNATTIAGLIVAGASGPATLIVDMPSTGVALTVTGDLGIGANATLTHTANPAGTAEVYRLVLNVSNNLTLGAGGMIQVTGCGYSGGYGLGRSAARGGGAHGGQGGYGINENPAAGLTYGSVVNPVNHGSASSDNGGARGGGVAILKSGGVCLLNGRVLAEGNVGYDQGAGAGGSINITAQGFSGGGTLSANGGNDVSNGGGGGGGRIALIASSGDITQFQPLTITAYGGVGATQGKGAAGTVYLQTAAQGTGRGTVMIANSNQTTAARTHIPPATNAILGELRYASVVVTNRGAMAATTNDRIASLTLASTNEPLNLGASGTVLELRALTVNGTNYTKGGTYTTNNWNGFASPGVNVTGAGSILIGNAGTSFMFR
jgi:hypothetical protein